MADLSHDHRAAQQQGQYRQPQSLPQHPPLQLRDTSNKPPSPTVSIGKTVAFPPRRLQEGQKEQDIQMFQQRIRELLIAAKLATSEDVRDAKEEKGHKLWIPPKPPHMPGPAPHNEQAQLEHRPVLVTGGVIKARL